MSAPIERKTFLGSATAAIAALFAGSKKLSADEIVSNGAALGNEISESSVSAAMLDRGEPNEWDIMRFQFRMPMSEFVERGVIESKRRDPYVVYDPKDLIGRYSMEQWREQFPNVRSPFIPDDCEFVVPQIHVTEPYPEAYEPRGALVLSVRRSSVDCFIEFDVEVWPPAPRWDETYRGDDGRGW